MDGWMDIDIDIDTDISRIAGIVRIILKTGQVRVFNMHI